MEFVLVLFIAPVMIIALSILGCCVFKKWYIMPIVTCLGSIVLSYTLFNVTFLFWVVIYTILSLIVSLIVGLNLKPRPVES